MKKILFCVTLLTVSIAMFAQNNADVVIDNIMTRTSVRSYTDQPVPQELVDIMLKAAMAAPTAMNDQPWEFVVVNDRATLDALAEGLKYAKMLRQAPLAIVVCAHTHWMKSAGTVKNDYWQHDASAATENILLAAHALGLGAVWTAACDKDRSSHVINTLGIKGDVHPLCVIPIGYPDKDNKPKDKWKPERVHYNKW